MKKYKIGFLIFTSAEKINSKSIDIDPSKKHMIRAGLRINGQEESSFNIDENTDLFFERDGESFETIQQIITIYQEEYHLYVVLHRTKQNIYYNNLKSIFPTIAFILQSHHQGSFYSDALPALLNQNPTAVSAALAYFPRPNHFQQDLFTQIHAGRYPVDRPDHISDESWYIIEQLKNIPRKESLLKKSTLHLLKALRKELGL
ncbi:MAG: hypothetical protein AAF985_10885 [Bacteroidota bacterium]